MSIKISIILSVFNSEFWIKEAIENIISQDFKEYEFIIVNDGSIDDTEKLILNYSDKEPKIKYILKKHTGLTDSLNYALKEAKGEWIARIDVDDISNKKRLSKQLEYVQKNKNLILLGTNFTIRRDESIIYRSNLPEKNNKLVYRLKNMKGFFPHSSSFFSREKALLVGGYRKAFIKSQDHDLWLRLSEKGKIACHQDTLVEINEHDKRISNSNMGWSQYEYAFTAITSHYLRKEKNNFIENKIQDGNIEDILEKANNYLEKKDFYKIQNLKAKIKEMLLRKNFIKKFISLFFFICKNKNLFLYAVKLEIFVMNLPYNFALELKKFYKNNL